MKDNTLAKGAPLGLARRINDLTASELHEFVQARLYERELHLIVRQLNDAVLSRVPDQSSAARAALSRLGFAD
ncbi:hypothetical protein P1J78_08850 [Psychromarinibacter sp. C21-152]|uniref:Uncharacterized protein n=1 Tax=Psychromarinibacter sediminicola TaxID=3033385 RepID=A0AAE3NRN8_9RHOB|nr:hypothetical protein [Psychromarinibacter sediminicola]MDF0600837.1 hypothetical protein [Psychromarinibacter sediminicola]